MRRLTPEERRRETQGWRESIVQAFIRVEDAVHAGLGTLLAAIALVPLVAVAVGLLYTVQVSFREQALVPEPFLIVGLIAAIRRLLVLTAEFARFLEKGGGAFQGAMLELGLLTVMIVALVGSLVSLRRRLSHAVADRAGAIETPEASV